MEQVTELKETCLSSQGVSTKNPNLNETAVIASETAGKDIDLKETDLSPNSTVESHEFRK
jgi:hypothetical protein